MSSITREQIINALRDVVSPENVRGVVIRDVPGGMAVGFSLLTHTPDARAEQQRQQAQQAVAALPGVTSVAVVLTNPEGALLQRPTSAPPRPSPQQGKLSLPGIRRILAVASGKGGVGKSTTAVNLALALQRQGLNVGMLDADIYGPSLPMMLGISSRPALTSDKKMLPVMAHGMPVLSIGLVTDSSKPVIWRGPMVMGAIEQMLRDADWPALDVLVIDLPPGTGDAQLTLAQRVPVSGAVIVSTPQDLALLDARKGLKMFEKMQVPIWGILENMSSFICPHCGKDSAIFGHGGAEAEAENLGVPFLGKIPLHIALREAADNGQPTTQPAITAAFDTAAKSLLKRLQ